MKFINFQEVPFIQEVTRTWIKMVLQEEKEGERKETKLCMYESDIACWPQGREDSMVTPGLWHEFHSDTCRCPGE